MFAKSCNTLCAFLEEKFLRSLDRCFLKRQKNCFQILFDISFLKPDDIALISDACASNEEPRPRVVIWRSMNLA